MNDYVFKKIVKDKYPLLEKYKKEDEIWQQLFVRMEYYIAKLEQEFNIPYIASENFNPQQFYEKFHPVKNIIFVNAMNHAAAIGRMDIVKLMIEKGANDFGWGLINAAGGGHMDMVKFMVEMGGMKRPDFDCAVKYAEEKGHTDIVNYLKQYL